ncbi:MAG: DMT family transporter [Euryarchaeota archaeon]|nr:DMT family transporter [Euryarchaeota archaeon]
MTEAPASRAPYGNVAVVVAILAVSTGSIFIRYSESGPLTVSFYRLLFTTLILVPWVMFRNLAELAKLRARDVAKLAAIGLVLAMHFSLWVTSLAPGMTSVANSTVLVTTHPLFVALIAALFLKERTGKVAILGGLLAVVGVFIMLWGGLSQGSFLGDVLAFGGALAAGTYIVAGRSERKKLSTGTYCLVVYGFATLFLIPGAFIESGFAPASSNDWLLFILMGAIPGILGHTMYNYALGKVNAFVVSTSLLGEPVLSSLMAFALFAEGVTMWTIVGAPLIFLGIVLAAKGSSNKKAARPPPKESYPNS